MILDEFKQQFSSLVTDDISSVLSLFLKQWSQSVRTIIDARHAEKSVNLTKRGIWDIILGMSKKTTGLSTCLTNCSLQLNFLSSKIGAEVCSSSIEDPNVLLNFHSSFYNSIKNTEHVFFFLNDYLVKEPLLFFFFFFACCLKRFTAAL